MYDMADLLSILTKNELREWLGYKEIDEAEMNNVDDVVEDDIKNNEIDND